MTCEIVLKETDIPDTALKGLVRLPMSNISLGIESSRVFIKGYVKEKRPLKRTKSTSSILITLSDDNSDCGSDKVKVLLVGNYAEKCQTLKENDTVIISNFIVKEEEDEDSLIITVDNNKGTRVKLWGGQGRMYNYTPLNEVKVGTVVNVFGVVKFFKPPKKTFGSDVSLFMSIIDQSMEDGEKLPCSLFRRDKSSLPQVQDVGDIVRLHRLKGKCAPGFSCLTFDGDCSEALTPRTNDQTYTLTQNDLDIVKELREWANRRKYNFSQGVDEETSLTRIRCLSEVTLGKYFNLTCQVVATCVVKERESMLLRVWDGTRLQLPIYEEDTNAPELHERLHVDRELAKAARGFIVDIFVFDNHFDKAAAAKPGDFVYFHNLHAARYTYPENAAELVPRIEFCLHRGNSYGRQMSILDPDDKSLSRLKLILQEVIEESRTVSRDDSFFVSSGEHTRRGPDVSDGYSTNGDARCMLNTATVVTSHHHLDRTKLRDVIQHKGPYKFRIRARLTRFEPDTDILDHFLKLYCPACHFQSELPLNTGSHTGKKVRKVISGRWSCSAKHFSIENGVKLYKCPDCSEREGAEESDLKYVYMLKLFLEDDTDQIKVSLWKEEAVKFFLNTSPTDLLKNRQRYSDFREWLLSICDQTESHQTWMEACVKRYESSSGVCYQIFDTTLSVNSS